MEKADIQKLTEIDQRSKSNTKRIDTLDVKIENIHDLTISVKEIAVEMKEMRKDMTDMNNRLKQVEEKPNKRFELIISTSISTIVGAIVGALIMLIIK